MSTPRSSAGLFLFTLLLSSPALAQSLSGDAGLPLCPIVDADHDGVIDAREGCPVRDSEDIGVISSPDGGLLIAADDAGVVDWRTLAAERQAQLQGPEELTHPAARRARPRLTVDLDTIIGDHHLPGEGSGISLASSLLSVRYRPFDELSAGALVPFIFGSVAQCSGVAPCSSQPTGNLGNLAVFAGWDVRLAPTVRMPLELLVAFATSVPIDETHPNSDSALLQRGFEDLELFSATHDFSTMAVAPKVGLIAEFSGGELAASVKVPTLVRYEADQQRPPTDTSVVLTAQAMARLPTFLVGLRAVFFIGDPLSADRVEPGQLVLEPRVEARFGGVEARVGFLLPLAGRIRFWDLENAWGLRIGVGYGF